MLACNESIQEPSVCRVEGSTTVVSLVAYAKKLKEYRIGRFGSIVCC